MTAWHEETVAYVEHLPAMGGAHAVGWHSRRECGCLVRVGTRLDTNEPTVTVKSCDDHVEEMRRALFVFGHAEPSDRDALEFLAELLDYEIEGKEPDV